MKITANELVCKLELLDQRILGLWIDEQIDMDDEEKWELFALLLESRVELLRSCTDAGVRLPQNKYLPPWLQQLSGSRKEIRLRDLKRLHEQLQNSKNIKTYESMARIVEKSREDDLK